MSFSTLTIATRESPLALKQTGMVKTALIALNPSLTINCLPLKTSGDKFLNTRLNKIGGKGLFTKELEQAMLADRAELAVHSMKDLPSVFPDGLMLGAILKREDPTDAFISKKYENLDALPKGAIIGTSSLRREAQLKALRPDIQIKPLRGNINTRLKKAEDFDAIVLASAGLKRMGFDAHINQTFTVNELLPAAGQGALGIECISGNTSLLDFIKRLQCEDTHAEVQAERALIHTLNGSCQVPIAAYCILNDENQLHLKALVGDIDGKQLIRAEAIAPKNNPIQLGESVAELLLAQDAKKIIDKYNEQ